MIGVFDSGYGGLSVLKSFLERCPQYDYVYLGDNARVPYGQKSPETVYRYSREAVDFLFARGARLVILACNTASALALRRLQREYLPAAYPERRILGVVIPIAEAVAKSPARRIGVIGTEATIASGVYKTEIAKLATDKIVIARSAPLLAPAIEEGVFDDAVLGAILDRYLAFLDQEHIEELVLACTHYPLVAGEIQQRLPEACLMPDPGRIVAESLCSYLGRHPELEIRAHGAEHSLGFCTTGDPAVFKVRGSRFLGQAVERVEKLVLK
jgi:glutamate racemase